MVAFAVVVSGGTTAFVVTHVVANSLVIDGDFGGRGTLTVMDTVPVPVASVAVGCWSLAVSCVPSSMSVAADDSGVTIATVTPHLDKPELSVPVVLSSRTSGHRPV